MTDIDIGRNTTAVVIDITQSIDTIDITDIETIDPLDIIDTATNPDTDTTMVTTVAIDTIDMVTGLTHWWRDLWWGPWFTPYKATKTTRLMS